MADIIQTEEGSIIFYRTDEDSVNIQVLFVDETVWMSQQRMAELFGADIRTVNEHLRNVYNNGELAQKATNRNFRIVQQEGNRRSNYSKNSSSSKRR